MSSFIPEIAARALMPKEIHSQASMLHLMLHVNPAFVSVTVADSASGNSLWNEHFLIEEHASDSWKEVCQFITARNWGDCVFRKCTISFDSADYTVLPSAFYVSGQDQTLLRFHLGKSFDLTDAYPMPELGAHLIAAIPTELKGLLIKYPNGRIFPFNALLARYTWLQSPNSGNLIRVWNAESQVHYCILRDRKLILLKSDPSKSAEDALYFVANACMQLGVNMEHATLVLGAVPHDPAFPKLFEQYVSNVQVEPTLDQLSNFIQTVHLACV